MRRDNNSLGIECSEMPELNGDHMSEEVVPAWQMARDMSHSTRSLVKSE